MSAATRRPYLGEDVHYQAYGTPGGEYESVCRAAKVTEVLGEGLVKLVVFNPTGLFFNECGYDHARAGGTFHYQH
jgi:hypothetical protein